LDLARAVYNHDLKVTNYARQRKAGRIWLARLSQNPPALRLRTIPQHRDCLTNELASRIKLLARGLGLNVRRELKGLK
jgi:hypothetical protein